MQTEQSGKITVIFIVMKMHSELRPCLFGYQFLPYFTKINFSLLHIHSDAGFMEIAQKTRTYLMGISTQMHHKAPHIMWFYTVKGLSDEIQSLKFY